jgi:hypothetical protein
VGEGSIAAKVRVYLTDAALDKIEPIGEVSAAIAYDNELGFHVKTLQISSELYPLPRISG